ncbi:DUF3365 domain-containing protein [Thalassococcus sp. S3]|uniref:c-type heme family protein n=1 Tax=Thalassococcus sp. S3 TaxID=2017482 RepID=UPI001024589A|nr:DUF3365 domain-containing protein [Thalassococcus sp. S3]QBF33996.1 signal protein [Thalassococcus sp. S3]
MGLSAKFNLMMLGTFVVALVVSTGLSYLLLYQDARQQIMQEVAIMSEQSDVIRDYTAREITPLLAMQMEDTFLPQSVPFWSAHTTFRNLQERFPNYSVEFPAINPTNPANRSDPWQANIITEFRNDPDLTELVREREEAGQRILSVARPIRIENQGCLACHSTPEAAPAGYVAVYGRDNGFGWQMDEIVAAQIVSVPMQVALDRVGQRMSDVAIGLTVIFGVLALILNLLLHRLVLSPLRQISEMADDVSLGNLDRETVEIRSNDEIGSLAQSFTRMRRSFVNAMKLLEPDV